MSIFPEPVATASKRSNTPTDTREIDTAKRYRFRPPRDAVYNLRQNTNCPPRARIGKPGSDFQKTPPNGCALNEPRL